MVLSARSLMCNWFLALPNKKNTSSLLFHIDRLLLPNPTTDAWSQDVLPIISSTAESKRQEESISASLYLHNRGVFNASKSVERFSINSSVGKLLYAFSINASIQSCKNANKKPSKYLKSQNKADLAWLLMLLQLNHDRIKTNIHAI